MLLTFRSIALSLALTAAREAARRARRDIGLLGRATRLTTALDDRDDKPLETFPDIEGTDGTAVLGGGGERPALPMPLGSFTELLSPPTLPGPRGMPLTPASPASWAEDCVGATTPSKAATISALMNIWPLPEAR